MIPLRCSCGYSGSVNDSYSGKRVKCKQCGQVLVVGGAAVAPVVGSPGFDFDANSSEPPRKESTNQYGETEIVIAADKTSWFDKGFKFGCGFWLAGFLANLVLAGIVLFFLSSMAAVVGRNSNSSFGFVGSSVGAAVGT